MIRASLFLSAFAVFWFLSFFCLLPVGLGDVDPDTGAPKNPHLLRKAAYASASAVVLFGVFYAVVALGVIDV